MNGPYVADYLRSVFKDLAGAHGVNQEMKVRPGTNVIDVALSFK